MGLTDPATRRPVHGRAAFSQYNRNAAKILSKGFDASGGHKQGHMTTGHSVET